MGRSGPLRNRKTNVETAKRPGWVPSSVLLEGLNVLWDAFYLSWRLQYGVQYLKGMEEVEKASPGLCRGARR